MADEWQDIETAPTNQSILIWVPGAEHYGDPVYRAILVDMGTGLRWHTTAVSCGRDIGREQMPTHWRPLPSPPVRQPQEVDA